MNSKNFEYIDQLIYDGKKIVLVLDIILNENWSFNCPYIIKLDINNIVMGGNGYAIDGKNKMVMFLCTGENIEIRNVPINNIKFKNPYTR